MIVGLTGGIGSGKSTVARFFMDLGVPVYDSDSEAKRLMNTSKHLRKRIVSLFGEQAYHGQTLNKKYLASVVFADDEQLDKLNAIVHPAVRSHFEAWAKKQQFAYVIQETALIFENNAQERYDAVILVVSPLETRIKRVMERDGVQKEMVLERMSHQLLDAEKMPLANFVITNTDLEITKKTVLEIHAQLLKFSHKI
ncbi:Dephospho-CoA kinase [Croceitalea dokdonensis DOKDO 023]|uniref:Dephospho-CoA kinase n=1 Tax=Croceitalea dokdonensis DOKDO 023 TaxID=1300341 RepID=A0A0P7AZH0_9FLAO|nr:dephospho-CoA kinase [Croceitalea dokdonensis]KPM33671.1 Dephospho-CoA kinase [Croceitalea dokdonensis DOKDO 023]